MGNTAKIGIAERGDPTKCPVSGYPVPTYFEPNTPIPLRVCKQNPDGTFCVYDAQDKLNPLVISTGNYQQIVLRSVSEIPSPTCTPEFSKDKCDPKDPYGGCYQPPNDNCNRMSDGSIYCPDGTPPPPIKSGCQNNATYCDMPPTGCGSGYVPGSYNGKQICVKIAILRQLTRRTHRRFQIHLLRQILRQLTRRIRRLTLRIHHHRHHHHRLAIMMHFCVRLLKLLMQLITS